MHVEAFTNEETKLLQPFVSNTDKNVFVLKNLPEVIKGALFSRYSRTSKGLRRLLLDEFILGKEGAFKEIADAVQTNNNQSPSNQTLAIQKAQDFYDRILDGYGDDSIGELGGAHLAVENVSNMGTKIIQDSRIGGSPLEKSTRYILFDKKYNGEYAFYKDPVILASDLADVYVSTNNTLFDTYSELVNHMKKFFMELNPQGDIPDNAYKFSIRAKACDALRGLLPTSTLTNMGVFGNGRFFENLILKLRVNNLSEMHNLGSEIHNELKTVIPSFVRRSDPSHKHFEPFRNFLSESNTELKQKCREVLDTQIINKSETVELVDYDSDAELKIITALLYENSNLPYSQIRETVTSLSVEQKNEIINKALSRRQNRRHKPPRAFEHVNYTFDVLTDFGSYRDLHRHRMLTQQRQNLSTDHGYDIPPDIQKSGFSDRYIEMMELAKTTHEMIKQKFPLQSQYIVPFAYKIRWYMKLNLRSIYWLTELRSGQQGHPTYRYVAQQIYQKVKEVHPNLAQYMQVDMEDYSLGRLESEMKKEKVK
jgi:thymidylate synthase ThyX